MSEESKEQTEQHIPETAKETEVLPVFPKIRRLIWDLFYDDEKNEVWVGIKLRATIKAQTRQGGPVEDVEVNHDVMAIITSLDAVKQEALFALNKDMQALNAKRQRQQALKGSGIIDRLSAGIGDALNKGKSILLKH